MKFGLFGSAKLTKIENDIDSSLNYNEWIDYNIVLLQLNIILQVWDKFLHL